MNSSSRTLTFVGVAVVSALIAWGGWSASQPSSVAGFGDIGQEFFAGFDEVTAKAKSLKVIDYDDEVKDVVEFSVKQDEKGLWVIPSHDNYPAEAKDKLAKTATSLMGVKKAAIQSRLEGDWKRFGVVDPSAEGLGTAKERGTRLTLADGSGNPLVDLIIGEKVEGRSGHYFVREPDNDNTYIAEMEVDLSAKFSDWIEPDLLKLSASDVVKVTLDNYSINEEQGTVEGKEKLDFVKADLKTTGNWQLQGLDADQEELDNSPITSLVTNLDSLKIVDVLPKPEGMSGNLRLPPQLKQLQQQALDREMSARGFFYGGNANGEKRLYANEGDMIAGLSNGVEYSLYFGEIARGNGKDIDVELGKDEAAEDAEAKEEDKTDDKGGPRRYLFLKAGFNEELLGEKPVAPVEPVKPEILQESKAEDAAPAKEQPPAEEAAPAKEEPAAADAPPSEADKVEAAPKAEEQAEDEAVETADETEAAKTDAEPVQEETAEPVEEKAVTEEQAKVEPEATKPVEPAAKPDETAAEEKTKGVAKDAPEAVKPAAPEVDPKQVAQAEYDTAMASYANEKRAYESQLKVFEGKVKTGQEKADELSRRFAAWYYIISSDSFEKFRVTRTDVIKKKEVKEEVKEEDAKEEDVKAIDPVE